MKLIGIRRLKALFGRSCGVFGIVVAICWMAILCGCGRPALSFEGYEPQEGDMAFRRGGSTKSMVVLRADRSGRYSHVGIVVATDSGFRIVHVTPGEREPGAGADTVKLERLDEFFASHRADHGEIARFTKDGDAAHKAAKNALRFFRDRIIFDHDYDLADTAKMYCTELVWRAYGLAGIDLTQERRSVISGLGPFNGEHILPSDIYDYPAIKCVFSF